MSKKALIVVDIQNDFLAGGSLEVKGANAVIPVINSLIQKGKFDEIIFTQDWHPKGHCSFASSFPGKKPLDEVTLPNGLKQTLWPDHCVQDTFGAEIHKDLIRTPDNYIVHKGTDPSNDSYSAFFDNAHLHHTDLEAHLRAAGINTLYIVGICFDICAGYSALDARGLNFDVYFVEDSTAAIGEESAKEMKEKLEKAGVKIVRSTDVIGSN